MHIFLFILYSLLLGYLVTRMRFFRVSGVRPAFLLLFFGLHVFAGCLQNLVAYHFFPGHGDVWTCFELSLTTRHELLTDFHLFLADNSNWAYMPHNMLAMIQMVLNWLSFDNLYIDTLLFSFPIFLGSFALFRIFRLHFPGDPLTALCAILIPSTLFWTSCIYTEGVTYALTGWLFYRLYYNPDGTGDGNPGGTQVGNQNETQVGNPVEGWNLKKGISCFFIFLLTVFFRSSTLITLLPALLLIVLATKGIAKKGTTKSFAPRKFLIAAGILILLASPFFFMHPAGFYRLPHYLITKQHEFQQLEGGSRLSLPMLEPSWNSFIHLLPRALRNGFFEPLPGSGGKMMYLAFSMELIFVWGIVLAALLRAFRRLPRLPGKRAPRETLPPFTLCCLFYAFSGMLLVGMIVPFAGAIVRYRSIYFPFLLAPFLYSLRLTHLVKKINIKLNKYIFAYSS